MKFKTPKFWQDINIYSNLLFPFSYIYLFISFIKNIFTKAHLSSAKIICVGNLTCGGAGKTPIAIEIAKILLDSNKNTAFLTRGYGGSEIGPIKIINTDSDPKRFGDEALILARTAPVYIAKKRYQALSLIEEDLIDIVIMDDGLQNKSVKKDIEIIVIDGEYGFGNERVLPAGPLRENIEKLNKVDLIILIGIDKFKMFERFNNLNIVTANYYPDINNDFDKTRKYIAFAGIGRPSKFFASLKEVNLNIIQTFEFPDHYFYNNFDIEKLQDIARNNDAYLITTEKDIVKIDKKYSRDIIVFKVRIKFDNVEKLKNLLVKKIINA